MMYYMNESSSSGTGSLVGTWAFHEQQSSGVTHKQFCTGTLKLQPSPGARAEHTYCRDRKRLFSGCKKAIDQSGMGENQIGTGNIPLLWMEDLAAATIIGTVSTRTAAILMTEPVRTISYH
jgi:hypothetical protein